MRTHPKMGIGHIKMLAKEHGVTRPTVGFAIRGVYNSEKSKAIRLRAIELLQGEIRLIKSLDNPNTNSK